MDKHKYFLLAYLWEGVIAKTILGNSPEVWRYHMFFSLTFPLAICIPALVKSNRTIISHVKQFRRHKEWYCIWCLGLSLGFWGIVSSLFQEKNALNLLYSVGFLGMFAYCWLVSPVIIQKESFGRFIDAAIIPIALCVLLSCIWPKHDPHSGRLHGIFDTTGQAAWSCSFCAIICFYRLHTAVGLRRLMHLLCFIGSIILTIMTRTRGHIGAMLVAIVAMLLVSLSGNTKRKSMVRTSVYASLAAVLIVGSLSLSSSHKQHIVHYFRLSGNMSELLENRTDNWKEGINAIAANSFLGQGWLSRWGVTTSSQQADYNYDDDPHNFVLTIGKSLGLIGCVIAIGLLIVFARLFAGSFVVANCNFSEESLLLGGVALWLIIVSLVGNILISFGATTDRYCWVIMSLLILGRISNRNLEYQAHKRRDAN